MSDQVTTAGHLPVQKWTARALLLRAAIGVAILAAFTAANAMLLHAATVGAP